MSTLLVALSHPDDEVGCAGTIALHAARGDRVVLLWLTRGTMSGALAGLDEAEVARIRTEHGQEAARILGAEARFLDFPDTAVRAGPDSARVVAATLAEIRPDAVVTWGDAWERGMRHPDHQATGVIVRDAITLARIGRVVAPLEPHREPVLPFTLRGAHSSLPMRAVDVSEQMDRVMTLAAFYRERVGWPEEAWLRERLEAAGRRGGAPMAELFDAWETPPGVGRCLF